MIVILTLSAILFTLTESKLTLVGEIYDKSDEEYDRLDFEEEFSNWYSEGVTIVEIDSDSDIPNVYEDENHVLIADPPGNTG